MENQFSKIIRYFLMFHYIALFLAIFSVVFVRISIDYFQFIDNRMPWQETWLNYPVNFCNSILYLLFLPKFFLIFSLIVFKEDFQNLKRSFFLLLAGVILIDFLLRFNVIHNLWQYILWGYDCNSITLNMKESIFL